MERIIEKNDLIKLEHNQTIRQSSLKYKLRNQSAYKLVYEEQFYKEPIYRRAKNLRNLYY